MRSFIECLKDAGASSVHAPTAIGNDRKRRAFNEVIAQSSLQPQAKDPDLSLEVEDDDIVHGASPAKKQWQLPLTVKKYAPEQQLIFGWASVIEKDGVAIIDKQGDVIAVEELENAAYEFTLNSRDGGDMHRKRGVAKLVESMVFSKDKQAALGVDLGQIGWWVGFKVTDPELWASHKRGERPEFSIGGAAVPIEI